LISPLDAEASLNIQATTGSAGAQVINELFAECWVEESWRGAGSIFRVAAVGSGEAHSRRNQWTTKSFKYSTRTKKRPRRDQRRERSPEKFWKCLEIPATRSQRSEPADSKPHTIIVARREPARETLLIANPCPSAFLRRCFLCR